MIEKWIKEYISDIDLNKIEWLKLNSSELDEFYKENYLDKSVWEYVHGDDVNIYPCLLGMRYLNLYTPSDGKKYSFFLGVVNNNINKKTIVSDIIYIDKYYFFDNKDKPYTYISTAEVNSYFRRLGLYKLMCSEFIKYINLNQDIITTEETIMGNMCHTFDYLKSILNDNGFNNNVEKYDEVIQYKMKNLKKN